ncbi:hypothetical protein BGZ73_001579 [Actinomortierella ambigua]|nr:hypothetical protein BGZ73_001579 [Actinomortierella ambigua]
MSLSSTSPDAQHTADPSSTNATASGEGGGMFKQNMSEFVQISRKVFFAAADRNKGVIFEQLKPFLAKSTLAMEVGSGSGQHIAHFAKEFPQVIFQPTEYDTNLLKSIVAYSSDLPEHRILPPLELNATIKAHWDQALRAGRLALHPSASAVQEPPKGGDAEEEEEPVYDLVMTTNVFHITPWIVTESILKGAGRMLKPGGHFIVYGPFKRHGTFSTESNREFDEMLRGRDASWGVRDLEDVQRVAEQEAHLVLRDVRDMPSNNYLAIFEKVKREQ